MKPRATTALSDSYLKENSMGISERIARAEFESNPPALQERRRDRVRLLLQAEAQRGQKSHSYLWTHAKEIYGV